MLCLSRHEGGNNTITSEDTPMTTTTFADEIAPVNQRFSEAIANGDAAGTAQVYTEDAVLMPPGMPSMHGKDAVQQFWQGGIQQGIKSATLSSDRAEVDGDLGYEVGTATLQIGTPDGQ